MSTETSTPPGGGQTPAAEVTTTATPAAPASTTPPPKSDAEAAQREAAAQPAQDTPPATTEPTAEEQAAAAERKKNRTRDYINRINAENADLRRRLQEHGGQPQPQSRTNGAPAPSTAQAAPGGDAEPTLEDCDFNVSEFQRRHSKWAVAQALKEREQSTQTAEQQRQQEQLVTTYNEKVAEFVDTHPDFPEVVGSIAYPLSMELQAAIMAHEKGVEIAYHLGNNDDEAFQLASIQPHLAAAAVERLAKRIGVAQPAAAAAVAAPQTAPTPAAKPISQAPPPAPRVSGRAPTETPPEKMTDDDWYRQERERNRKR